MCFIKKNIVKNSRKLQVIRLLFEYRDKKEIDEIAEWINNNQITLPRYNLIQIEQAIEAAKEAGKEAAKEAAMELAKEEAAKKAAKEAAKEAAKQ